MNLPLRQYWQLLVTYLRPRWLQVLGLAVLLFIGIGMQLTNPQIVRAFIDTATAGSATQTLSIFALLFFAVTIVQRVSALAAVYVGETIGWAATNNLRADLTRHCLRLDMGFHKRHTPGELIERIDSDVTAMANFFSQLAIHIFGNALLILGIIVLLLREDWRIGFAILLYAIVAFVALVALQRIAVNRWTEARKASAEQYGFLEERITGTEDIRANGGEPYVMRRLYTLMQNMLRKQRTAQMVSNITFISVSFLFIFGYGLGLTFAVFLYTQNDVSIGTAYLFVYYIGMLAGPLEQIREQMEDLQQATASIYRVEGLFDIPVLVQDTPRTTLPMGALNVTFNNVSFAYNDATPNGSEQSSQLVLHDVSFRLEPGRVLGLLGRTGSGKTTISRLMFRLYDPTAGSICLNDVDLREVGVDDLRNRVGMVTQDVQLFQASIRDNLTFFSQTINDSQTEEALRTLGLWSWVEALPNGLETQLTTGGQGLSAGEAQLLAFARVFLKDPGLVILDEASSRLDLATEGLLAHAIDRLFAQRSAIIITHRLQTVQRADDILILENGSIVEYGSREQLACDKRSYFYTLLQTDHEEILA
ncbi:MAG: ABC transporter ATP-binding protein [Chloroflexi bacterium AL-W]|nr:ABC transporter ATP-binding protein [Chloroflexi bacterium AL-N1]NOK67965.1 ABC transporter ATP-binding protein [Chloroflexi bacterium AL-N10]NOK73305.1 ABC transporter ATP-binding protein [Chloroflexi bacterium AL-N5]NOK83219.1 ABC transporter ATP-binding protein [Chloroflexi bacterium AL-W]NOK87636.1 ABC transporter ATP-binding protein [Chloroflexi bacterium AL-N15]